MVQSVRLSLFAVCLVLMSGCHPSQKSLNPSAPKPSVTGEEVTLLRDRYSIPHVFAAKEEAGMFAIGYAQAEDRIEALLRNYKRSRGELTEIDGEAALPDDLRNRSFRLTDIAREKFSSLSPQLQSDLEAFCAGVNRFQKEHADRLPAWAFEVTPYDVVAFSELINLDFAIDYFEAEPTPAVQGAFRWAGSNRGSNAFAVSRSRTADGKSALLSIDPHLEWNGSLRWYEMHLACGPLNVTGVTFVGLPMVIMGHNGHVAWANTVNFPDLSDKYEEHLAGGGTTYLYEGKQKPLIKREFLFRIKQSNGNFKEEQRNVFYTPHGPVVMEPTGKNYAVRKAGWGNVGMLDQIRKQCLAQNIEQYRSALTARQVVMFNHLFADGSGRIAYVWSGCIPGRPAGYDFHRPVPGWIRATEWKETVPFAKLPQIMDPMDGFVENCNHSPLYVAPHARAWLANGYPNWLAPDLRTARGNRMTALLQSNGHLSAEMAMTISTDVLDLAAVRELPSLLRAAKNPRFVAPAEQGLIKDCVQVLEQWDRQLTAEARGAAIFAAWIDTPGLQHSVQNILPGVPNPAAAERNPAQAVHALAATARAFKARGIALDVAWGTVHRLRKQSIDLPLEGGSDSLTPNNGHSDRDGKTVGTVGASYRMVVELRKTSVRAWSYVPYGNSDDPASPSYTDQMALAAKRQYRPVPFTRDEVEAQATTRKTFTYPTRSVSMRNSSRP